MQSQGSILKITFSINISCNIQIVQLPLNIHAFSINYEPILIYEPNWTMLM
jgi:hypothetical protein